MSFENKHWWLLHKHILDVVCLSNIFTFLFMNADSYFIKGAAHHMSAQAWSEVNYAVIYLAGCLLLLGGGFFVSTL